MNAARYQEIRELKTVPELLAKPSSFFAGLSEEESERLVRSLVEIFENRSEAANEFLDRLEELSYEIREKISSFKTQDGIG